MAIVQDLQQVATLFGGELDQSPVVQHQQVGLGQGGGELGVTSIAFGDGQLRQEPRQAQVLSGVAFAASLVRQGAGDPGLADTGGSCNQDIEMLGDPLTGAQAGDE